MKNWMKSVDLDQMKDQLSDLKDQVQEIRFRKPWTMGGDNAPILYLALGAALAWTASALYKNRDEVANFCTSCGTKLKNTLNKSGLKEKAGRMMDKAEDRGREAMASTGNGQEPLY